MSRASFMSVVLVSFSAGKSCSGACNVSAEEPADHGDTARGSFVAPSSVGVGSGFRLPWPVWAGACTSSSSGLVAMVKVWAEEDEEEVVEDGASDCGP